MAKEPYDRVIARSVSMYPAQWALLRSWAKDNGFSVSLALRKIIHEWTECKNLTRLVDTRESYEVEEA